MTGRASVNRMAELERLIHEAIKDLEDEQSYGFPELHEAVRRIFEEARTQ